MDNNIRPAYRVRRALTALEAKHKTISSTSPSLQPVAPMKSRRIPSTHIGVDFNDDGNASNSGEIECPCGTHSEARVEQPGWSEVKSEGK